MKNMIYEYTYTNYVLEIIIETSIKKCVHLYYDTHHHQIYMFAHYIQLVSQALRSTPLNKKTL